MPWKVFRENGKFCLHKMNPDDSKGRLVHCHDTAEEARRQQAALYVSEKKEMSPEDVIIIDEDEGGIEYKEVEQDEEEDGITKDYGEVPAYGTSATSFEELEAERQSRMRVKDLAELMTDFQTMAGNIIYTPEAFLEGDKIEKLDGLYNEFKTRATSVMNEDASSEKAKREDVSAADRKRAVGEYGNVTYADPTNKKYPIDSEKHIRAAWSYINMPRNASKYPDKGAAIKRRIIAAWKKKIDSKGPPQATKETLFDQFVQKAREWFGIDEPEIEDKDVMMVYKEADGTYGWISAYSNKFMDRDNPPDIIASFAHQEFVEKVGKGLADLPNLELWHVPEWKIGYATALAYDDSGFPIAIGRFDDNPEAQKVAEWLTTQKDFGVSHGMWNRTIQRDPEDPSVIIAYETHEISPLPRSRAANELADWFVLKNEIKELEEVDMTIPEEKRQELLKRGLPEETLLALEQRNKVKAELATADGVKSKESTEEEAATQTETETQPVPENKEESAEAVANDATEETASTEETPETPVENKDAKASDFPTRQEVAEAVTNVITPLLNEIADRIGDISKELEETKSQLAEVQSSDEKRIKEIIAMTPRDSLATLMATRLTDRASLSKQTKIGDNDKLLSKKPREEEPEQTNAFPKIGINFIDEMRRDGK